MLLSAQLPCDVCLHWSGQQVATVLAAGRSRCNNGTFIDQSLEVVTHGSEGKTC